MDIFIDALGSRRPKDQRDPAELRRGDGALRRWTTVDGDRQWFNDRILHHGSTDSRLLSFLIMLSPGITDLDLDIKPRYREYSLKYRYL